MLPTSIFLFPQHKYGAHRSGLQTTVIWFFYDVQSPPPSLPPSLLSLCLESWLRTAQQTVIWYFSDGVTVPLTTCNNSVLSPDIYLILTSTFFAVLYWIRLLWGQINLNQFWTFNTTHYTCNKDSKTLIVEGRKGRGYFFRCESKILDFRK